jgi:hypothetical protein
MRRDPIENATPNSGRQATSQEFAIFDPDQGRVTATIGVYVRWVVVAVEHLDLDPTDDDKRRHSMPPGENICKFCAYFKIYNADSATNNFQRG